MEGKQAAMPKFWHRFSRSGSIRAVVDLVLVTRLSGRNKILEDGPAQ
jgi:hypothetical protein